MKHKSNRTSIKTATAAAVLHDLMFAHAEILPSIIHQRAKDEAKTIAAHIQDRPDAENSLELAHRLVEQIEILRWATPGNPRPSKSRRKLSLVDEPVFSDDEACTVVEPSFDEYANEAEQ